MKRTFLHWSELFATLGKKLYKHEIYAKICLYIFGIMLNDFFNKNDLHETNLKGNSQSSSVSSLVSSNTSGGRSIWSKI